MSSSFADALVTNMLASMDPNVAMQRDAMQGFLEVQKGQVKVAKGNNVSALTAQLIELKNNGFDDNSVPVVAINKLIHSLAE